MAEPTGAAAAQPAPLQPPAATLTLTPPEPAPAVAATQAPSWRPRSTRRRCRAGCQGGGLRRVPDHGGHPVAGVHREGRRRPDDGRRRHPRGCQHLEPVAAGAGQGDHEGGLSNGSKVGKTLVELRRTVEDLDPKGATGARKIFGMIPFGNKMRDYFQRYQSAQSHLNAIIKALYDGQDELRKDNISLTQEKQALWAAMGRLNQYIYIAERLDSKLSTTIAGLDSTDPERAKALREDVLFYVRRSTRISSPSCGLDPRLPGDGHRDQEQPRADQGCRPGHHHDHLGAADGGDRGAGAGQPAAGAGPDHGTEHHDVPDDREHLGDVAGQLDPHPGRRRSATIGLPELQKAFANIYATMDAIDQYKVAALDTMAATIGTLETETEKAKQYLDRAHANDSREGVRSGSLDLVSVAEASFGVTA